MASKLNAILIIVIILVLAGFGYFGLKVWRSGGVSPQVAAPEDKFEPVPITNKGKESEERDAAMEADVREIDAAVRAYAKDHNGDYPVSYFKDICNGVRMCLKGVNINSRAKVYLDKIPQVPPVMLDYHYSSDNDKKTYCIRTPNSLETQIGSFFQCASGKCGRVPMKDSCG